MTNAMFTYQTRPSLNRVEQEILSECACIFSHVERSLYAEVAKGNTSASCKNAFLKKFAITARQFNACRVSLEGKIAACKTSQTLVCSTLKQKIDKIENQIKILEKKPLKRDVLHQKRRRKAILLHKLNSKESDRKKDKVRLCFGGKKLFNAQFHLEKNKFHSHQDWKKAWEKERNNEFFVLGSKDEISGNQSCTAYIQSNQKLLLRLRLPKALEAKYGKYLEIKNVFFDYGQEALISALNHKQAISYRLKQDEKGWRIFASTAYLKVEPVSLKGNGCIGLDLNVDHIASVETDRFGNIVAKTIYPWVSYGKTRNQIKAITGDICKTIILKAIQTKKAIVIENLDFQKKKSSLENKKLARMLSSFSYGLFFQFLHSKAFKSGIQVYQVNPAFTSIIGRVNYATRYGLSIHLAAALCIARRYQQFSESPCFSKSIPDGKGSHVAFVLPERNRTKHVWHFWAKVKKKLERRLQRITGRYDVDPSSQI